MSRPALHLVPPEPAPKPLLQRGYLFAYRQGEVNYCPGCSGKSWIVRRVTAECAFAGCGVALPIVEGR